MATVGTHPAIATQIVGINVMGSEAVELMSAKLAPARVTLQYSLGDRVVIQFDRSSIAVGTVVGFSQEVLSCNDLIDVRLDLHPNQDVANLLDNINYYFYPAEVLELIDV